MKNFDKFFIDNFKDFWNNNLYLLIWDFLIYNNRDFC